MKKINKIFLFILPLFFLAAGAILDLSLQSFKGAIFSGGCGCDIAHAEGNFDVSEAKAVFLNQEITAPLAALPEKTEERILGEVPSDQKWIEIDLSEQKLIAWQGDQKFLESLVSSGKWAPTPKGEFRLWGKYRYIKMSGGSKELQTYYYLPNVPYAMFFYKDFGLHGTYWHNNFGQPMSHGCVNLPTFVAEKLFYWTTPTLPPGKNFVIERSGNSGTKVIIHD
ncbi:MAG: L,D-transpeptidase [Microgenomates group bacterium]